MVIVSPPFHLSSFLPARYINTFRERINYVMGTLLDSGRITSKFQFKIGESVLLNLMLGNIKV